MALKTFVKVGNVSNLSDARYCAGMEVDLLGFPFDGENAVSTDTFTEITGWVSGVEYVAEFRDSDPARISEVVNQANPGYVQICDPQLIDSLPKNIEVILEVDAGALDTVDMEMNVSCLVISGELPGGISDDFRSKLKELSNTYKILLETCISPENVGMVLQELPVHGIAMKGSDEIRPGYKDYDQLADILEILEIED